MLVEAISKAMAAVKSAPSGNGQSVPLRFGDLRLGRGVSRLGATQLPAGQSSVCARRSDVCLLMSRHTSPAPSDAPSLATALSTSAALTRIHGSHHRWSSHDSSVVGGLTSPSATPCAHCTHASERRREGGDRARCLGGSGRPQVAARRQGLRAAGRSRDTC